MAAGLLVLALLVLGAGYRMLRGGFGRICDDFLYPYLRLARVGSSHLGGQAGDASEAEPRSFDPGVVGRAAAGRKRPVAQNCGIFSAA